VLTGSAIGAFFAWYTVSVLMKPYRDEISSPDRIVERVASTDEEEQVATEDGGSLEDADAEDADAKEPGV
jgi:hypothetical protein